MLAQLRPALVLFAILTIVTGVLYPLAVTGLAQAIFPHAAQGSIIIQNAQPVGSELIGQSFTSAEYFWGRPSATGPVPYNGAASSGSNLGPTNPQFLTNIQDRVAALRSAHPDQTGAVPGDLVTASGSGLDPHISPAAALYQVQRIAKARHLAEQEVRELVQQHTQSRTLGVLGEPRVNVLQLNLALDALNQP